MFILPALLTHDRVTPFLRSVQGQWPLGEGAVQVDASGLVRFDSSALAVLLELRRQALARGRTLQVQSPPARLVALAAVYGVAELLALPPG